MLAASAGLSSNAHAYEIVMKSDCKACAPCKPCAAARTPLGGRDAK